MITKLSFAALALLISGQVHAVLIQGPGFITASTDILPCDTLICGDTLGIDQIADGDFSDDRPFNGFAGLQGALGIITLDLTGVFDLRSFTLWNDINVRAEGVNSFQLEFFNTSDESITTSPEYSAVSQVLPQTYTFGSEILGVSKVDLIVLSLIDLPESMGRVGIEIREVAFNGMRSPSPVPIPAAVWLFGTALIGFVGMSRRRKIA